jgi:hypothetical protein
MYCLNDMRWTRRLRGPRRFAPRHCTANVAPKRRHRHQHIYFRDPKPHRFRCNANKSLGYSCCRRSIDRLRALRITETLWRRGSGSPPRRRPGGEHEDQFERIRAGSARPWDGFPQREHLERFGDDHRRSWGPSLVNPAPGGQWEGCRTAQPGWPCPAPCGRPHRPVMVQPPLARSLACRSVAAWMASP